ncbi:unnamed protein product [Dracunculus medinensis]|uniref:SCP domain-containing protein n=1 Tax=Dracunculus medinensis TaxID=318479 RepID=A0A0N4U5W9_DRAME|nr:unnamed protein product [Dracunculus medinensis]
MILNFQQKLERAKRLLPNNALLAYKKSYDADGHRPDLTGNTEAKFAHYQLKFWTTPGNAFYEVTLLYDWNENSVTVDMKSISHINKYGDLPHCIIKKNYFMAMYCVCYDKINQTS